MIEATALLLVIALIIAVLLVRREPRLLRPAIARTLRQAANLMPLFLVAMVLAAYLQELLPSETIGAWMGESSGMLGIVIASVIGMVIPGGPMVTFPLVVGLMNAGAGFAQGIALITAWSAMGAHRVIGFELPFLGWRFVLVRCAACILLAPAAGLAAAMFTRM